MMEEHVFELEKRHNDQQAKMEADKEIIIDEVNAGPMP